MGKNQDIIAIYSRKSRFTGKGESIGNQVDMCRTYIATTFGAAYAENAIVFEDEGFSGGNLNRPDFKRMMKAAEKRQFRAVVVYRLDRISRNISDFAALIEQLGHLKIDFISIRESFDTSSPMGRAMMYIASVFSQLERETIAERIRDNMHELAKTGRWLGGITPTGYTSESVKSITVDGKSKKAYKLKIIPAEAEIVRIVYALYIETDSLTMTEAELLRRCIKTKNGCHFTRFSIKAILQNPVYLIADRDAYQYFVNKGADLFSALEDFDGTHGILAYNRTDQKKGRSTVYLPISEWIVAVGQHPGMISAKQWIQVQESLERNKSKAYHKPQKNEALLTGLLWCQCGNRMYPKLSQGVTENGQQIYTYICKMKERSKRARCNQNNINGNQLDAAIMEELQTLEEDRSYLLAQLEKSKQFYTDMQEEHSSELEELQQEQEEIHRKVNAMIDALADFEDDTAMMCVKKRIKELSHQNEEIQSRIAALNCAADPCFMTDTEFDFMRRTLATLQDGVYHSTVEQKRAMMRHLVQRMVWDGKYVQVLLFGAENDVSFGMIE